MSSSHKSIKAFILFLLATASFSHAFAAAFSISCAPITPSSIFITDSNIPDNVGSTTCTITSATASYPLKLSPSPLTLPGVKLASNSCPAGIFGDGYGVQGICEFTLNFSCATCAPGGISRIVNLLADGHSVGNTTFNYSFIKLPSTTININGSTSANITALAGKPINIPIKNAGSETAYDVSVTVPAGWPNPTSSCPTINPNTVCNLTYNVPLTFATNSKPANLTISGANTNSVALTLSHFSGSISTTNINFQSPDTQDITLTNNSNAPVTINGAQWQHTGSATTIFNTVFDTSNCETLSPQASCKIAVTTQNTSYGSDNLVISYTVNPTTAAAYGQALFGMTESGNSTVTAQVVVAQPTVTVAGNQNLILLNPTTNSSSTVTTNVAVKNNSNFVIQGLDINGKQSSVSGELAGKLSIVSPTDGTNCLSQTNLVNGDTCYIGLKLDAGVTNGAGTFTIGSSVKNLMNQITENVSVSGGVSYVVNNTASQQHMQYKSITVSNASDTTTATITPSWEENSSGTFELCYEGKTDCAYPIPLASGSKDTPSCVYNSDSNTFSFPSGQTAGKQTCNIWMKTNQPVSGNDAMATPDATLTLTSSIKNAEGKPYVESFSLTSQPNLYGYYQETASLFQWAGNDEQPIPVTSISSAIASSITAMSFYNGDLYISSDNNLYRFTGSSFILINTGITGDTVTSMATFPSSDSAGNLTNLLVLGYDVKNSTGTLAFYDSAQNPNSSSSEGPGSIIKQYSLNQPVQTVAVAQSSSNTGDDSPVYTLYTGLFNALSINNSNQKYAIVSQNNYATEPMPIPYQNSSITQGATQLVALPCDNCVFLLSSLNYLYQVGQVAGTYGIETLVTPALPFPTKSPSICSKLPANTTTWQSPVLYASDLTNRVYLVDGYGCVWSTQVNPTYQKNSPRIATAIGQLENPSSNFLSNNMVDFLNEILIASNGPVGMKPFFQGVNSTTNQVQFFQKPVVQDGGYPTLYATGVNLTVKALPPSD